MPDCQLNELAQGNHQDSLKAVVVMVAKLTQSRQRTCCMIYIISFMSGSISSKDATHPTGIAYENPAPCLSSPLTYGCGIAPILQRSVVIASRIEIVM